MSAARKKHFEQRILFPIPQLPPEGGGSVAEYLLARPGWRDRQLVAGMLGLTDREVRDAAEHSGGAVIFASERGKGLCHVHHASETEVRACVAELMARADSHIRRAREIMAARFGGT